MFTESSNTLLRESLSNESVREDCSVPCALGCGIMVIFVLIFIRCCRFRRHRMNGNVLSTHIQTFFVLVFNLVFFGVVYEEWFHANASSHVKTGYVDEMQKYIESKQKS